MTATTEMTFWPQNPASTRDFSEKMKNDSAIHLTKTTDGSYDHYKYCALCCLTSNHDHFKPSNIPYGEEHNTL